MHIVAGCDGGGTKCAVRIARVTADDLRTHTVCDNGFAGGANVATNLESAIDNVAKATSAAMAKLQLPPGTRIDRFVAALAGSTRIDKERLIAQLEDRLNADRVSVVPDVAVLFAAADVSPPAVATIIGTGSIAWLRSESDSVFRSGGEGPQQGDLGSGYWIGRSAFENGLVQANTLDAQSVTELARLAPSVFDMANGRIKTDLGLDEDRRNLAKQVIRQAAQHITDLVIDVVQQWKQNSQPTASCRLPWIVAGGVAVHQLDWVRSIHANCVAAGVNLAEPIFVQQPVEGALRIATHSSDGDN